MTETNIMMEAIRVNEGRDDEEGNAGDGGIF